MPELLFDLENFLVNDTIRVPHLIRCALIHYQFETIQPFLDGNGRIGRLLITLYLIRNGLLTKPSLYLSAHLERYKTNYFDSIARVQHTNDIGHWCRFFLKAVADTAENGKATFKELLKLRQELEQKVVTMGRRASNARKLILHLFRMPAISVNDASDVLDIQYSAANQLVSNLVKLNILEETSGQSRNRIFVFRRYINTFLPKR